VTDTKDECCSLPEYTFKITARRLALEYIPASFLVKIRLEFWISDWLESHHSLLTKDSYESKCPTDERDLAGSLRNLSTVTKTCRAPTSSYFSRNTGSTHPLSYKHLLSDHRNKNKIVFPWNQKWFIEYKQMNHILVPVFCYVGI
jgi:hypothetical protein